MKNKKPKTTKRQVNGAVGVRKEVAEKFSAFCTARGWQISIMAEQALAEWMRSNAHVPKAAK